ncbi:hypothetical protein LO80_03240 [Candidatus Francisella endociliophora]|uniref:Uncharacterized protein n=1 Tax=Candidatus Francisella endociliophora TaxID=653937 RepID=A0A097END8_9GAMM|nr:hypothetical protein [Francisella sp. FSC1006]AIT09082.1 hypothetical protein LO80_03240 [Francisella sp. FSC1006]
MAHSDYIEAAQDLIDEIDEYGVTVKLVEKVRTAGASRNSGSFSYNYIADIKILKTSKKNALIGGAVVVIRDDWLEMADIVCLTGNTQEIKKDQYIEIDNTRYVINQLKPIDPADYVIGYWLSLKGV